MLIVANWKAYIEDLEKAKKIFAISKKLARETRIDIVLAPPSPLLSTLSVKNRSSVVFSAQDVSLTTGGAKTGEATAEAFVAAGASYAIVGHSERRSAGDTYPVVAEKLSHAIAHKLTPILCVGEDSRDSEGRYLATVREELTTALEPLDPKDRAKVIVAYEPLWAIGKTTDDAINPNDLAEMVLYIRKVLAELLPGKASHISRVLYGGSVESGNVRDLARTASVDGFLVGHASVDPKTFAQIVRALV